MIWLLNIYLTIGVTHAAYMRGFEDGTNDPDPSRWYDIVILTLGWPLFHALSWLPMHMDDVDDVIDRERDD